MTTKQHHAEWLSLMEVSGPFLTMPVLQEAMPNGLDRLAPNLVPLLREAVTQWEADKHAQLHALVQTVLREVLGFAPAQVAEGQHIPHHCRLLLPEYGETLAPDYALMDHAVQPPAPLLLVSVVRPEQKLDSPMPGSRCSWSPAQRMAELCRSAHCPLGLVSNGHAWMLVHAPASVGGMGSGTVSYITWYTELWMEERLTLQAFVTLLGAQRFFACAEQYTLPRLMQDSANKQHEVTDALGRQVRSAMTEFMRALDRIDRNARDTGGIPLLAGLTPQHLYEATLTVMMRLVFLLAAEERGLLRLGEQLYDEAYAVATLCDQLRSVADNHGEEVLEYRHDAWTRLLALFRAVHGGVEHENMRLPAYGGSLFDPDRYPFLEGRPAHTHWRAEAARPIPVDNRVVLHMLESLLFLRDKAGTGQAEACRLSFRGLDVEQIGHVYEGLLDRTARRAEAVLLGLAATKERGEPHLSLTELEEARIRDTDGKSLLELLKQHTGKPITTLRSALKKTPTLEQRRTLNIACGNDAVLLERVLPFTALLREDSFGLPVIIPADGLYIAPGSQRRDTGTHYTPRHLTEILVKATLEPHVYEGANDGLPRDQWQLHRPAHLLGLKICDMAMGSGAFLVQCCRHLGEKLSESWQCYAAEALPQHEVWPDLPAEEDERLTLARRMVADRCLYGVDINPLAVEMAKLSLWLVTLQRDRPFTFVDHALKQGDSLLGVTSMKQLEEFSLDADSENAKVLPLVFGSTDMRHAVSEAVQRRTALECIPSDSPLSVQRKEALLQESEDATRKLRWRAHALVLESLAAGGKLSEDARAVLVDNVLALSREGDVAPLRQWVEGKKRGLAEANPMLTWPFHWALEFPEVFDRDNGGFDVLVGNPPFLGSQRMREALGNDYREHMVELIGKGARGKADLVAYFFLRAAALTRWGGDFGLIATNTLAQGDTREVGLLQLEAFCDIRAAWTDVPWSGDATVATSQTVLRKGKTRRMAFQTAPLNLESTDMGTALHYAGHLQLNDQAVAYLSSFLIDGEQAWEARPLQANAGKAFIGSYVLGEGFLTTEEQAQAWIAEDASKASVLFPYLIGEDVTTHPEQKPSRWIINFWDWSEQKAQAHTEPYIQLLEQVKPIRQRRKVDGSYQLRLPLPIRWWHYADKRPALYHALGRGHAFTKHPEEWNENSLPLPRVLVTSRVSKHGFMAFVPNNSIYSEQLVVFASADAALFALLQSTVHHVWARKMCSTLETRLRYTPSSAFDTFPRPLLIFDDELPLVGENLHARRAAVLKERQIGLTTLYNALHNPKVQDADMVELRRMHADLDVAVARAYGWEDLDMGHAFRSVGYLPDNDNTRHTIPEDTRLEILRRLTRLNKERWEAEQAANTKPAPKAKATRKKSSGPGQGSLLV